MHPTEKRASVDVSRTIKWNDVSNDKGSGFIVPAAQTGQTQVSFDCQRYSEVELSNVCSDVDLSDLVIIDTPKDSGGIGHSTPLDGIVGESETKAPQSMVLEEASPTNLQSAGNPFI